MGTTATPQVHDNVIRIPVGNIHPNPWNPNAMDEREFKLALNFIRAQGFIGSIVVRPKPGSRGKYEILDGEHRWRAAQECGLADIPAVCLDVNDADARIITYNMNQIKGTNDPQKAARYFQELRDLLPDDDITAALDLTAAQIDASIVIGTTDFNWDNITDNLPGIGDDPLKPMQVMMSFDRERLQALEEAMVEQGFLGEKYTRADVVDQIFKAFGV